MYKRPKMTSLIFAVSLFTLCFAATARGEVACEGSEVDTTADIHLASLRSLYYPCTPMPPDPTSQEIDDLKKKKSDPKLAKETEFLEATFPNNLTLQAWAVRDYDNDGVTDFRISGSGEFRENEPDVDCDGIANVLDPDPYGEVPTSDAKVCIKEPTRSDVSNDKNNNGVPDHIDWRILDAKSQEPPRPAEVQEGLLRDYGIVLVDRRQRITPAMARELNYVIRHIYKGQITPNFPSLKAIAADNDVCHGGYWAWASAQSATLFFHKKTLDLNPFLRLEILVHELAHMIQFSKDFTPAHRYWLRSWNGWQTNGFRQFIKKFDWEATRDRTAKSYDYYELAVPSCGSNRSDASYDPVLWSFKGKDTKTWSEMWDFYVANNTGPLAKNEHLKSHHMIGNYALGTAWEWHAEYTAAYVINRLVDAAEYICDPNAVIRLKQWLQKEMDAAEFNYYPDNARGLDVYEGPIADQFQVSDGTWVGLARYFIRASNPAVCELPPLQ